MDVMATTPTHVDRCDHRWAPAGFSVIVLLALMATATGPVRVDCVHQQARTALQDGVAPMVVVVRDIEEPALWRVVGRDAFAWVCAGQVAHVSTVWRAALVDLPPPGVV
ncbi:MAG: hypothetical protein Tsb0013_04220 [Phycisphaerales bacterium]